MRVIEQEMMRAIETVKEWSKDNTRVNASRHANGMNVYLYGNFLGRWDYDLGYFVVDVDTLRKHPTNTTKSRLRALDVDVCTRKGVTYLNGKEV